jgi:hypothetical protein
MFKESVGKKQWLVIESGFWGSIPSLTTLTAVSVEAQFSENKNETL